MKKNNQWMKVADTTRGANFLELQPPLKFEIRAKFFRNGVEATRFLDIDDVDLSENSAEIILEVDNDKRELYKEDDGEKIIFWLKKEYQESLEKCEKCKREACINFLNEKAGTEEVSKDHEGKTDIRFKFTSLSSGKIVLEAWENGKKSHRVNFDDKSITSVSPIFYQVTSVTLEDTDAYQGVKRPKPEEDKPFWTAGKIFLAIIILVILTLLVIFWKKIWCWIKGESSQEKKVREQIDIF